MLAASSAIPVVTGSTVPGRSGCIPASPGAVLLPFLLQSLGCRFVVDIREAPRSDSDSHDIVHFPVGLQDMEILVLDMLE